MEKLQLIKTVQYQTEKGIYKIDYFGNGGWHHSECWKFDNVSRTYTMIHKGNVHLPFFEGGGGVTLEECEVDTMKAIEFTER